MSFEKAVARYVTSNDETLQSLLNVMKALALEINNLESRIAQLEHINNTSSKGGSE